MPRGPRLIPKQGTFHIMIRGNNKRRVFYKNSELVYFKNLILKYKKKCGFLLYHYALMPNHIHLCIKALDNTNISKAMQGLQLSYHHFHRRRYTYVGHLWQGRFKSRVIDKEDYLLTVGIYIEKNPVEGGIVKDPADYPWSSYRYYAYGEKDPLVDPNPLYMDLGRYAEERQTKYRELMQLRIEESKTVGRNDLQLAVL